MNPPQTQQESYGKVAKRSFRVPEEKADRCAKDLDFYLDSIIRWHPTFKEGGSRQAVVQMIGDALRRDHGHTFVELVYLTWRYVVELRARVRQMQANHENRFALTSNDAAEQDAGGQQEEA